MYEKIEARLKKANQVHLLKFWNELNDEEKISFDKQLELIDFEECNTLFQNANASMKSDSEKLDSRMQPIPEDKFESETSVHADILEKYRDIGLQEISEGHVAVLLLAGGQGTRLGVTYPKGMYSVGLPSGKTLFQIQAERIRRISALAEEKTGKKGLVTWYIMTSGPTHEPTLTYLKNNNYFGLSEENVVLFRQGVLPCFDLEGKILLDEKYKVSEAPDGNGGIYRALDKSGILTDIETRGIKYVHVHSVDNILVKVADPVFIGYCISKQADCGAKVVKKSSYNEAVGVICQVDRLFQVVEYSEISENVAKLTNPAGDLVYSAGNICNHFFTTNFLRQISEKYEKQLKLHVALKKIPYIELNSGSKIKPDKINGIKIEKFIFDVFQFTNKFVTWEVPRISEFSALKNDDKAGKDCPSTARKDLLVLHKNYILKAGGTITNGEVEISPLLSYAGENLSVKDVEFNVIVHVLGEQLERNGINGDH